MRREREGIKKVDKIGRVGQCETLDVPFSGPSKSQGGRGGGWRADGVGSCVRWSWRGWRSEPLPNKIPWLRSAQDKMFECR
jgi:hypothetical protein